MSIFLMPDVERALSEWLRDQPELTALVGQRIYTSIPANPTWPLLRLVRLGGPPLLGHPLWIDKALVQFDAWGGPKHQAWEVAETTRAVLDEGFEGVHPEGVIVHVDFGEFRYAPDDTYSPARPRYTFSCDITAHPGDPLPS